MNPQTSSYPPSGGNQNLLVIALIAVLALGTAGFGALAIIAFGKASKATSTLKVSTESAAQSARADQKKLDVSAAELAAESPYRSYGAPLEYGSFEIRFPKNWSGAVLETRSSTVQVDLTLNPNFLRKQNNIDDPIAARVTLNQRTLEEYTKQYATNKVLKRADIKVAGIPGYEFTGPFPDRRTKRLIAVPVRDKTLVFISENTAYASEFDQILAQSRINP